MRLYLHTALIRAVDFKIMAIGAMEAKKAGTFTCNCVKVHYEKKYPQ